MTPVQYTTDVFQDFTMSPFQTWKTMNGKVCISARTYIAYEIHRWKTCNFSCGTPVKAVMKLLFGEVAKTKGIQASDIQPVLVAIGGELPYESSRVLGQ